MNFYFYEAEKINQEIFIRSNKFALPSLKNLGTQVYE